MALRRGFTLAEVLVALVIVSLGLLALISVQIYAMKAGRGVSDRHLASVLAVSQMSAAEDQLRKDFSVSVARPPGPASDPKYRYEVLETEEIAGLLKEVQVVVTWKDQHGDHEYRLSTRVLKE